MDILMIAQTIFYFVSSAAILALSVLLIVLVFNLLVIVRDARKFTDDLALAHRRIKSLVARFISSFTNNKKKKNAKKEK